MKALFLLLPLFSSVLAFPHDAKGEDCEANCPLVNCVSDDALVCISKLLQTYLRAATDTVPGTMRVHQQPRKPLQRDLRHLRAKVSSMFKRSLG